MNYFQAISKRADELNELGNAYLSKLPFMTNDVICDRLWDIAKRINDSDQENPDWVDLAMDGYIPYSSLPRNGSIYFALGFAVAARDARLRNLLEVAEGRETEELALEVLAEKEIVDSYTTEGKEDGNRKKGRTARKSPNRVKNV